ncbi:MAG TPA: twin-arginine translocation signal domain-containing protein [Ktedonobacterales bacterium]|nr:twin-arginine translocation signal domain-containing protein [Ktedonobacterales bacterium]
MDHEHNLDQFEPSDDQQGHVEDTSRRNFLKAAVVASAAVAVAGGAAGFAIASGKAPTPFLSFVGFIASGSCIPLKQGAKFSGNNPNNFLQVDNSYLDSFGTKSSTKDSNNHYPLTFTRCGNTHQIHFTLTDKTNSNYVITGTLVESMGNGNNYSYQNGSNGDLYLAFTNVLGGGPDPSASLADQFPEGSCLTLSCS